MDYRRFFPLSLILAPRDSFVEFFRAGKQQQSIYNESVVNGESFLISSKFQLKRQSWSISKHLGKWVRFPCLARLMGFDAFLAEFLSIHKPSKGSRSGKITGI